MNQSYQHILSRLGRGESIDQICQTLKLSREQFVQVWNAECRRRVPKDSGKLQVDGLRRSVQINRDQRGLPHISADNDADLFFGFGYATGQDRLFQLDYCRRRALGRLAEILGPEAIDSDVLCRTMNLGRIAETEFEKLPAESRDWLSAYSQGINAAIDASRTCLPIEFDLLEYQPEPWSPRDSLAIVGEFRWYLTGRFPVIVVPELVKRAVGDGPLYRAFLAGEEDEECILPLDSYPRSSRQQAGQGMSGHDGPGSNNWVLAGSRTPTGRPLLASDPHVPFSAVSLWHEVHLHGGTFHVGGIALVGMPAVLIGRNERMAWGVTNNICSQRDLYLEQTDPAHPGCFLYDGKWEQGLEREEVIEIRNAAAVKHTVCSSRNGPLIDQLLPPAARALGKVSVRWLGAEPCGWLPALLGINRSTSAESFRESIRPWHVPTFNVVFADADGHIGYECSGRLPRRGRVERAFRRGWDPADQWDGLVPLDGMPRVSDPPRGFLVTANNRIAPDDYAHPLSGTWVTGYRARCIREQLESWTPMSLKGHQDLQLNVFSERASRCVALLIDAVKEIAEPAARQATEQLKAWGYHVGPESVPAAIFNVFFVHWCRAVAAERLPREAVELVAAAAGPVAVQLLQTDNLGWFHTRDCQTAIQDAFRSALEELTQRLGPDIQQWNWGRLHVLTQKHFLSKRGDLAQLLDHRTLSIGGDAHTVNNTSPDDNHAAWLGATYRFIADLADPDMGWWSVESGSASGHPGSPHYNDQLRPWYSGELFYTSMHREVDGPQLVLTPKHV